MIGEVQKGNADAAMMALSLSADRARGAEMGTPYTDVE